MEPCYVENYNIIEQSLLLFVIGVFYLNKLDIYWSVHHSFDRE